MKLLTKAIRAKLPQLYAQDKDPDPVVWVKFFCPWSNWTWLATEGSGVAYVSHTTIPKVDGEPLRATRQTTHGETERLCQHWLISGQPTLPFSVGSDVLGGLPSARYTLVDFRFFGYVHGLEDELGYFSLRELKSVHGPGIWSALSIERDMYFTPAPLSEVLASHTKTHGWTPTWTPRKETDNE